MSRWSGARVAPAVVRTTCAACGQAVDDFTTRYGRHVQLNPEPIPDTANLDDPDVRHRVWERVGVYAGWAKKTFPQRNGRDQRTEHRCENEREHTSKRENEKENAMSNDMFDGPGTASGIAWSDLEDRLLLIKAHEKDVTVDTAFGQSTAVRADVTVLDGDGGAEDILDTLIFPKVLQGQVKSNAGTGRFNLGRLGKGTAKPGQSAPWMLADPTEADKDAARAHLASGSTAPF